MNNRIAIVCDCDETLAPDTTNFWLSHNQINTKSFWSKIDNLVSDGWDPPIAWMTEILELIKQRKIKEDTNRKLHHLGKKISPYKGVPGFITQLKTMVEKNDDFARYGIKLEFYIISSGFEDLIKGTKFASFFDDIFGGRFAETDGKISHIKSAVTFTEKTKFLYAINKGISGVELRKNPSRVNDAITHENRAIPFSNMIYLGDSPGDIPCFSAVKSQNGHSIGIMGNRTTLKGLRLARGNRTTVGPYTRNYARGRDLFQMLETVVKRVGYDLVTEMKS